MNPHPDSKPAYVANAKAPRPNRVVPVKRQISIPDLLAGAREVTLVYKDSEYRLRVTSNDKIILTK